MEIGPPAPSGRRKWPKYTSIRIVRAPSSPENVTPGTTCDTLITLTRMTAIVRTVVASALAALAAVAPAHSAAAPCDTGPWTALLRAHLIRYPAMQPADAYKLLHQATLGSEHAVPSRAMAEEWLSREIGTLPAGPADPLADTLGTDGRFARIHLRPFLAAGGIPDSLLSAFVRTAEQATRDTAQLSCALDAVRQMTVTREPGWSADSVDRLFGEAQVAGYPAMHHSDAFEEAYHPAYRVVSVTLVPVALP